MMLAARASGTSVPAYTESWPCEPESAEKARKLVSAALSLWGVSDSIADGELIASELASNAIRHAGPRGFRITVSRPEDGIVKIRVVDFSHKEPVLRAVAVDCESGRGMHLVALLSARWGCEPTNWGKTVWAEMKVAAR
jgi:anti-sigma regulatory factor (Ser/Thr protein kinase)